MLSPAPVLPRSLDKWLSLPRDLDRFLGDHFGLRAQLVRAHGVLRYAILLPTDLRVLIGRDEWLFLNGDGTIEQATGHLLRAAAIEKFAERAKTLQARLNARNARFIVAIPPNGPTINRVIKAEEYVAVLFSGDSTGHVWPRALLATDSCHR